MENKIGIIGGSGFPGFKKPGVVFLNRHGQHAPPHMIDHKTNILALRKKGVKEIISTCSVGSLKMKIKPGTVVVPHDYINLRNIDSFLNLKAIHQTPRLSETLRRHIIRSAKKAKLKTVAQAVYIQTIGPRFETKAEINMIKNYADIVGMTMGSEAALAQEMGLEYAALCMVDNYANGIGAKTITEKAVKAEQKKNKEKIIKLLENII